MHGLLGLPVPVVFVPVMTAAALSGITIRQMTRVLRHYLGKQPPRKRARRARRVPRLIAGVPA